MPTPVSAARPCLSPEASTALDSAVAVARRRSHAQTTSLHFISSLLSTPLLRDALSRSRSTAYSPRLQFKALELCFSVALDRLPSCSTSSSSSPVSSSPDEPPVSNSLMAAIKRSQANQRRNPDTFHLYQQQNITSSSSSSFSGVKVELQQLILAILDDPVVSRVFAEAGFRSSDIKLAILRPSPPSILRFPNRCPPLFLCSFSNGSEDHIGSVSGSGEEHCRRIGDILSRVSTRNPMLVGAGAGDAAADFAGAVSQQNWSLFPPSLKGIKMVNIGLNDADKIEDMVSGSGSGPGSVMNLGDLNDLVEGEKAGRVVQEVSRVLEVKKGSVWVTGWTVNYETYLKFLSKYPLLDKDWELQLLPITSVRPNNGSDSFNKSHSFIPFGGFFPETMEPVSLVPVPVQYQAGTRCQSCNYKYEQEAMTLMKASSLEHVDQVNPNLPSWIPKSNNLKALDENKFVLNGKIANLQKKWTEYCHRMHSTYSPRIDIPENNFPLFPRFIPLQNPPLMGLPKQTTRPVKTISLPSITNQDLISRLTPRDSKSEQIRVNLSEIERHDSPSSINSVTTDLALATPREPEKTLNPNLKSPINVNNSCRDSFDLTSYKSFILDLFKRVGRQEEALRVISQVVVSYRANPNPNPSKKGIWLGFKGGDLVAQRRTASALAEMVSGSKENLVSVDLSREYFDLKFRGKTSIDYIAGEITKMPSAVVYIENVDKSDLFLVREGLSRAIQTGKLRDSNGREISIGGRIFLLGSRRKGIFSSSKEYSNFTEERILSAKGRKMKIIEYSKNSIGSVSSGMVVISRRCEPSKRKIVTSYGSPKRPNLGLDLNLSISEPCESEELESNNYLSEDDNDPSLDGLFQQIEVVEFRDFNFDVLADEVLREISKVFCDKFGSENCNLEIENNAMEQILASAWMVEEREVICKWVKTVLGSSFGDLKQKCNRFLVSSQFRLVLCEEDPLMEGENWTGSSLLPSRIILN